MTIGLLIISVILLVVEVITASTMFIWFALGGFVTAFASLFIENYIVLTLIFGVTSLSLMALLRTKVRTKLETTSVETSYEKILNQKAIVLEEITPTKPGSVKVSGQTWSARSESSHAVNEEVSIIKINGSHVIVK